MSAMENKYSSVDRDLKLSYTVVLRGTGHVKMHIEYNQDYLHMYINEKMVTVNDNKCQEASKLEFHFEDA